jgi:hypothetical protein
MGLFFAKSSSHGEESELQEKTKKKKKWKNGCRKSLVELLLVPRKVAWDCFL